LTCLALCVVGTDNKPVYSMTMTYLRCTAYSGIEDRGKDVDTVRRELNAVINCVYYLIRLEHRTDTT
jgi:hypothetical protein